MNVGDKSVVTIGAPAVAFGYPARCNAAFKRSVVDDEMSRDCTLKYVVPAIVTSNCTSTASGHSDGSRDWSAW